jgi:Plant transposon protein
MDLPVLISVLQAGTIGVAAIVEVLEEEERRKRRKIDHRKLSRSQRRMFKHAEALRAIQRDYLGKRNEPTTPLFGAEFSWMFRITKSRFQVLLEDIMASPSQFFRPSQQDGHQRCSVEAKVLLPLKTFAYGVAPHAFSDYFQMSRQYARDCCKHFARIVKLLYTKEFLRVPTKDDLKNIAKLHEKVHGTAGLLGSLDCTHTHWKNCPKGWQGSYKGKYHFKLVRMISVYFHSCRRHLSSLQQICERN